MMINTVTKTKPKTKIKQRQHDRQQRSTKQVTTMTTKILKERKKDTFDYDGDDKENSINPNESQQQNH